MSQPRTFTLSRRALNLGKGLLVAAGLLLLPSTLSEWLWGYAGMGLVMLTCVPALILTVAGGIIVHRARYCPRCDRHLKRDAVPYRQEERGGIFYCPHCGAQLQVR